MLEHYLRVTNAIHEFTVFKGKALTQDEQTCESLQASDEAILNFIIGQARNPIVI